MALTDMRSASRPIPSPRLKLLWVSGSKVVGGAERSTIQIAELLRERGIVVETLCRGDSPLRDAVADQGLTVHEAHVGGNTNVMAPFHVWRAVRRLDPDFVIATGADDWLWTSLTPLPAGISLVLVRHMSLPLPALLRRLAGRRARAIVTVAESVRKIMLDGSVLTPQRVVTIYNPVRFAVRNELPTREEKELARRSLNLPVGPALLLFCGGLNPGKGLADAARAVTVASRSRDIQLVVCGPSADDGDPAAALERLTQEGAGRTDRLQIRNLGRFENMKALLTAADVLLLPTHSNLREGMPLIVAEAMALGAPIVAYAVGGVSEALVADRDCGRLIETDNVEAFVGATIETLQDRSQAEAMALRASKRAKSLFDPQASADSWERLLNSLAARGP